MAYDYDKLSGKIVEKYKTQFRFAEAMGLSERSISLKMNGKVGFKQSEITRACELLGIKEKEICEYFFKEIVQAI